jgi:hypothetical protein
VIDTIDIWYYTLWMRTLCGVGTPRSLQGHAGTRGAMITVLCTLMDDVFAAIWSHTS